MRPSFALLPLVLCAAPALGQSVAPPPPRPIQIPPQTADRLADSMQSLSQALLDMRVGGVQAAIEGRKATAAEKNLTVRDLGRRKDPNFDRNIQQQIAAAKPRMEQSIQALNQALPEMSEDIQRAQRAIERAMANMPDPNYPKR